MVIHKKPIKFTKILTIKKYKFESYKILSDELELNFIFNNKINLLKIYFDSQFKPLYIIIENENILLLEKIELINSIIDNFEKVEDLIIEIHNILNELKILEIESKKNIKKNIKIFEQHLDEIKNIYIINKDKYTFITHLFSFRSILEMINDQFIKIYTDDRFIINHNNLVDFENVKIILKNFTFMNSINLQVEINLNITLDFISTPPKLSLTSNILLKDDILQVIENLKPFNDTKSWSIKYSIYDVINNIYNMINVFGEVEYEYLNKIELLINDLEYLFSIKNNKISVNKLLEIFDKDLINNSIDSKNKQSYWKKGTGYGNNNDNNTWNIDEYAESINNKRKNINIKMHEFIRLITKENIKIYLNEIITIFDSYMNDEIITEIIIKIASILYENITLFDISIHKISKLIKNVKEYLNDNMIEHEFITDKITDNIIKKIISNNLDDFQKIFTEFKFTFVKEPFKNFYYDSAKNNINININSEQIHRLQKEFVILKKSITISKDASIFFKVDNTNINKMRYIITGPKDTPYALGLFIFDMTIPSDFPTKPPLVYFSNNGNKRFNPNLYNCGKVCLSLLGTWNTSNKGEAWNSTTSTFIQLLISIQSQILIDEPYFNEPGYEKYIGKEYGIKQSKIYNDNIVQYNLDHAINELIEGLDKNYKEFDNIIKNYFKFNKKNIIKQNNQIYSNLALDKKELFKKSMDKFMILSSKL
jgi:ubiquitin-protein ligase